MESGQGRCPPAVEPQDQPVEQTAQEQPQTGHAQEQGPLAGQETGYQNWFEALAAMEQQMRISAVESTVIRAL